MSQFVNLILFGTQMVKTTELYEVGRHSLYPSSDLC